MWLLSCSFLVTHAHHNNTGHIIQAAFHPNDGIRDEDEDEDEDEYTCPFRVTAQLVDGAQGKRVVVKGCARHACALEPNRASKRNLITGNEQHNIRTACTVVDTAGVGKQHRLATTLAQNAGVSAMSRPALSRSIASMQDDPITDLDWDWVLTYTDHLVAADVDNICFLFVDINGSPTLVQVEHGQNARTRLAEVLAQNRTDGPVRMCDVRSVATQTYRSIPLALSHCCNSQVTFDKLVKVCMCVCGGGG